MNSLRSRLVVGSALVAVVPLAVVMVILSQRVERMVRAQAAERLTATLGGLQARLTADGDRTAEKLRILSRDPQLKRLYLVRPTGNRDLQDYLEERRFLLDLDFLGVRDAAGTMIAEATAAHSDTDAGAGLAMAARAPIQYQGETTGVVAGGLTLDAGFLARLKQSSGVELALYDASGRPVATTLGTATIPSGGAQAPLRPASQVERLTVDGRSYVSRSLPLDVGAPQPATIVGFVPTAEADRTIAALQTVSVLLGVLGLAIAVLLGLLWSSQLSRPVERLAAFSDQVARGEWEQPLELHSVRELETLVTSLDRMRLDLKASRDRLVVSERQAAWGLMARKVAHEINNPLTPIGISVADLQRSYETRRDDFPQILAQAVRTVTEEVGALKRLLREFADFARFPAPILAPCRLSSLFTGLGTLYGRDVAEGRLIISPPASDVTFSADAGQLQQAMVNLIKNGLEAVDGGGRVTLSVTLAREVVTIAVSDTGPALSDEQRAHLFEPGFTTKAQGSGLGLTIVERIVSEHGGTITVDSGAERGTTFRVRLPLGPGA